MLPSGPSLLLRLPRLGRLRRRPRCRLARLTTGLPQELFDLSLEFDANIDIRLAGHGTSRRTHRRRGRATAAPGYAPDDVHHLRDDPEDDEQERQEAFEPVEPGGEEWDDGIHGGAAPKEVHWPPATAGTGPVAMLRRMSVSACRLRSL